VAYQRTQVNRALLAAAVVQALGAVALGASAAVPWPATVLLAATVPISLVFSRLTLEVEDGELRFWFGSGFWTTHIPVDDIASIEPVENPWWWGWGIRLTPDGWLYNVSGRTAVGIVRHSGTRLRIGTDEPHAVIRAVQDAQDAMA
jgi:hypothetical protein